MKKKPLSPRRPNEAMARFDRLLAAMAPKPEPATKKPLTPRGTVARKKTSRDPSAVALAKAEAAKNAK